MITKIIGDNVIFSSGNNNWKPVFKLDKPFYDIIENCFNTSICENGDFVLTFNENLLGIYPEFSYPVQNDIGSNSIFNCDNIINEKTREVTFLIYDSFNNSEHIRFYDIKTNIIGFDGIQTINMIEFNNFPSIITLSNIEIKRTDESELPKRKIKSISMFNSKIDISIPMSDVEILECDFNSLSSFIPDENIKLKLHVNGNDNNIKYGTNEWIFNNEKISYNSKNIDLVVEPDSLLTIENPNISENIAALNYFGISKVNVIGKWNKNDIALKIGSKIDLNIQSNYMPLEFIGNTDSNIVINSSISSMPLLPLSKVFDNNFGNYINLKFTKQSNTDLNVDKIESSINCKIDGEINYKHAKIFKNGFNVLSNALIEKLKIYDSPTIDLSNSKINEIHIFIKNTNDEPHIINFSTSTSTKLYIESDLKLKDDTKIICGNFDCKKFIKNNIAKTPDSTKFKCQNEEEVCLSFLIEKNNSIIIAIVITIILIIVIIAAVVTFLIKKKKSKDKSLSYQKIDLLESMDSC